MTEERLQLRVHPDLINYFETEQEADAFLEAVHLHVADAVSTALLLCKRYNCMKCMFMQILPPFFDWVNEEGYKFITEGHDFDAFFQRAIVLVLAATAHLAEHEKCDREDESTEEESQRIEMPMVSTSIN